MHTALKTARQKQIHRIEELIEQLVLNAVIAALNNLIEGNKGSTGDTIVRAYPYRLCPYADNIQF